MNIKDAIYTRYSVRKFTTDIVDKDTINKLIQAGTQAPSAMNSQPWAFSVIQDKDTLKKISNETKVFLLEQLEKMPLMGGYRNTLANPDFDIFYNGNTLLTIYAKQQGPCPDTDCSLAAENIMLMAHSLGLGTCWIGFAKMYLNEPAAKKKFGIPDEYTIAAPIIIGYPMNSGNPAPKKEAEILFWK